MMLVSNFYSDALRNTSNILNEGWNPACFVTVQLKKLLRCDIQLNDFWSSSQRSMVQMYDYGLPVNT